MDSRCGYDSPPKPKLPQVSMETTEYPAQQHDRGYHCALQLCGMPRCDTIGMEHVARTRVLIQMALARVRFMQQSVGVRVCAVDTSL